MNLRNLMEVFTWTDARTGTTVEGCNPPKKAKDLQRKPFYVKYVTGTGKLEEGYVTCIAVDRRRHQRKIQFVNSQQIRVIRDYLVIEVSGIRIVS